MEDEYRKVSATGEKMIEMGTWYEPLTQETFFSKYFSMVLFVVLPFVGFWLGLEHADTQGEQQTRDNLGEQYLQPAKEYEVETVVQSNENTDNYMQPEAPEAKPVVSTKPVDETTVQATSTSIVGPPNMLLSVGDVTQAGDTETYCWISICSDGIIGDRPNVTPLRTSDRTFEYTILAVESPETLLYTVRDPVDMGDWPNDPATIKHANGTLTPSLSGEIELDVQAGTYMLVLSAVWNEGDVHSVFKIEVQ